MRRECEGLEFATSSKQKYFQLLSGGLYWVLDRPIPKNRIVAKTTSPYSNLNQNLKQTYISYIQEWKSNILAFLKNLDPYKFEEFCGEFLKKYGFQNVVVTNKSKDGGIDGFGELKIGFTHLEVAFQCKRYNKSKIQPKDIREFRGCIKEKCIYGIFFTTAEFNKVAIAEADRKDLKAIVLIDGNSLVDFMIKERFGIDIDEEFVSYVSDLDNII